VNASDATALIPCRAGSKGLKNKNLSELNGLPLYRHSVHHARAAGFGTIHVSTDISAILNGEIDQDVQLHHRPDHLAQDHTPMIDVVTEWLAANPLITGPVVLLQPTSPLRQDVHICEALDCWRQGKGDLVMSVTETDRACLKYGTLEDGMFLPLAKAEHVFDNRQNLPPVVRPNGAIYVFGAEWMRKVRSFSAGTIAAYTMPAENSLDIDKLEDLNLCQQRLVQMGVN